ncbi:MAG TPA: class I SAM-dependent RNA methyltransferase [bacterium]|nr:class I SAM-dependent RNA methyltransferase [bacterium]
MSSSSPLFATCQPGLEPLLLRELTALDVPAEQVAGGAAFQGDVETAMRCCLWLGTASHVRATIAQFSCRALGELQRKARDLPWSEWLLPQVPLAITARARRSRVYHTGAIKQRVRDAIAEALGAVPPARDDPPQATLLVRFDRDTCSIQLDAAATPLHRRGYRLDGRKAPLREDIAHALVLASGWRSGDALLDPFCGSGTIGIEAAAIALGLPPGRLRAPPFEHTARFDADTWQRVNQWQPTTASAPILLGDRDAGAVAATAANAERAGVSTAIETYHGALTHSPWLLPGAAPNRGVVVSNPPYGIRVRGRRDLLPLYQTLGHRLGALGDGWRTALLAHDVRLARRTGLPLHAAFTTRHGGLSVTAMTTR